MKIVEIILMKQDIEQLWMELDEIAEIRNAIVHEDKQHSLTVAIVKEYIDTLKKSVQLIQQKTLHLIKAN